MVCCLAVLFVKSAMFKFGCKLEVQVSVETRWRFYNLSCPRAWTKQVYYCSEGNLIFRLCLRRLNLSLCRLSHLWIRLTDQKGESKSTPLNSQTQNLIWVLYQNPTIWSRCYLVLGRLFAILMKIFLFSVTPRFKPVYAPKTTDQMSS